MSAVSLSIAHSILVSSIAKQILFPLETCMFFNRRAEAWIAPLAFDPAYLHAMIFTSQYYFDALKIGTTSEASSISKTSVPHYLKTLKLLRERMAIGDDEIRLSDTTSATIMALVGYARLTGDDQSARNHLEGLFKIVNLRGGVSSFKNSAKLLVEILRYVIIHSIRARKFLINSGVTLASHFIVALGHCSSTTLFPNL